MKTEMIEFEIVNSTYEKEGVLKIEIKVQNFSDTEMVYYRPSLDDCCFDLLFSIYLIDNKGNSVSYFPCSFIGELDHIKLSDDNSFNLSKNEFIVLNYSLNINEFSPSIDYESIESIRCDINYADTEFSGEGVVFRKNLSSVKKIQKE